MRRWSHTPRYFLHLLGNGSNHILAIMANGKILTTKWALDPTYLLLVIVWPKLLMLSRKLCRHPNIISLPSPFPTMWHSLRAPQMTNYFMKYPRLIHTRLMTTTNYRLHRPSVPLVRAMSMQLGDKLLLASHMSLLSYQWFVPLIPWSATVLMVSLDVTAQWMSRNLGSFFSSILIILLWRQGHYSTRWFQPMPPNATVQQALHVQWYSQSQGRCYCHFLLIDTFYHDGNTAVELIISIKT